MQIIDKYRGWIIAAVALVIVGGLLLFNNNNNAQKADEDTKNNASQEDKKAEEAKKKEAEAKAKADEAAKGETTYTAEAGDSYTTLARQAVQKYASDAGVTVSDAQKIAAETFLTSNANATLLEIGQKVAISKNAVADAVKKAQALSTEDIAAWQTYVPYVVFDQQ